MKKKIENVGDYADKSLSINSMNHYEKAKKVAILICEREGFDFVHLEYKNEVRGKVLRLYIDKAEGITIDDCVNLSRSFSVMLDVEWNNDSSYSLEVSSPGIERPLVKLEDFTRFCRKKTKIKLVSPIDGRKKICGRILSVFKDIIKLRVNNETIALKYSNIAQARLVALDGDS